MGTYTQQEAIVLFVSKKDNSKKSRMKLSILILLSSLLFFQLGTSCKKEPIVDSCKSTPVKDTVALNQDFSLVWSDRDNRGFSCYGTVVTHTSVVYFVDPAGPGGDDIVALDKLTGDTLWNTPAQHSTSKHRLVGNTICYSRSGLVCIDVATGTEKWRISEHSKKELDDFIYANNKLYAFFNYGGG